MSHYKSVAFTKRSQLTTDLWISKKHVLMCLTEIQTSTNSEHRDGFCANIEHLDTWRNSLANQFYCTVFVCIPLHVDA